MEYLYTALWFLIAIILFVFFRREGRLIVVSIFTFLFMGCWRLANILITDVDLMNGIYGWIFKGVVLAALVVGIIFYMRDRNKNKDNTAM